MWLITSLWSFKDNLLNPEETDISFLIPFTTLYRMKNLACQNAGNVPLLMTLPVSSTGQLFDLYFFSYVLVEALLISLSSS